MNKIITAQRACIENQKVSPCCDFALNVGHKRHEGASVCDFAIMRFHNSLGRIVESARIENHNRVKNLCM